MNKISIWLWWFYYFNFTLLEKLNFIKQFKNFNWVEIHVNHWYVFSTEELKQLKKYKYNTIHLLWYNKNKDKKWLEYCTKTIPNFRHFVLHPDIIQISDINKDIEKYISFENMDIRKKTYRTAKEMNELFKKLPNSKFTLDINHLEENNINIKDFNITKRPSQIHFSIVNKNFYKDYSYINTPHALAILDKKWFHFELKKYNDCIITTEWVYIKEKPELIQKEIDLINNLLQK